MKRPIVGGIDRVMRRLDTHMRRARAIAFVVSDHEKRLQRLERNRRRARRRSGA